VLEEFGELLPVQHTILVDISYSEHGLDLFTAVHTLETDLFEGGEESITGDFSYALHINQLP
jgi:hypothetical protein